MAGLLESVLPMLGGSTGPHPLICGLRGIERETLRIDPTGMLALTAHPPALGSALTHPYLTTDYSEALLEFVTPPFPDSAATLEFLSELHAFVYANLGDELLWPPSMPCIVSSDEAIPIAQYGSSNEGRLRTVYRSGLGLRYGRAMQAIAGVHFNYSPPLGFWPRYQDASDDASDSGSFKSECLMRMVRNFRRVAWVVGYLYGASPAFCKSFRPEGHERLESFDAHTWFAPFATSLRMSDMGYRNRTQARLNISVNSLSEYVSGLKAALATPEPSYAAIGVERDGSYRQLNTNLLQIENEYYSAIRPKRADPRLRPVAALAERGVEYVEVRTLDLNPEDPLGIDAQQMCFVEVLLLYCLLSEGPPITASEQAEIDTRELTVAWEGRRPGIELTRAGRAVPLADWGREIAAALLPVAEVLDRDGAGYRSAVEAARDAFDDADRTPSARVLAALKRDNLSFFEYGLDRAQKHRDYFADRALGSARRRELDALARRSLAEQAELEAAEEPAFGDFLRDYLAV